MDRRFFLKAGAFSVIAARLGISDAFAAGRRKEKETVEEKHFGAVSCEGCEAGPADLSVRFLGTGASGWTDPDCGRRRHSSVLLDNSILIDLTFSGKPLIPEGVHPKTIFYTHSHGDHFDPKTALEVGITKVYCGETWVERCRRKFDEASVATGIPSPKVLPLIVGKAVEENGLRFTPLPANHATSDLREQALIYLVEKGTTEERLGVRMLYATDTGGLMGIATRLVGIDSHLKPGRAITAFVMEGTLPMNREEDYRIFNHSTIETVGRTANMLLQTGRYLPPEGQPAYITHMSTKNFLPHEELQKALPYPLRAAKDGLDVVFRAVDLKG